MMKTINELTVGQEIAFGEIWDGELDGDELLDSGSYSPDEELVVEFEIVERCNNPLDTLIRITDLF